MNRRAVRLSQLKFRQQQQRGAALFVVLILSLIMASMMAVMSVNLMGHNKANRRSVNYDKALLNAETGVQRMITALAHGNDAVSWDMRNWSAAPASPETGFWLWQWQSIKDENGKEVGRYRIEIMPSGSNKKIMRLKASGMSFPRKDNGLAAEAVQRSFGVELRQLTLGDFAIATNYQLGGARINGGARIYGGLLTSGELHLDASSTGIFNEYVDLNTSQNFQGYPTPSASPEGEVFVYKDPSISGDPNGVVKLAAQATLGTADHPMQKIHVAEDSTAIDPGDGSLGTEGDGIIGNGESRAKGPKDHNLPDLQFPDASVGSNFMQDSFNAANDDNNQAVSLSDVTFGDTDFSIGLGPALEYDASTHTVTVNGPVYIKGNVTVNGPLKYAGHGGLFVEGDFVSRDGIEPADPSTYPQDNSMAFVCSGDMQLGESSGNSTKYAGFFFGNHSLTLQKAKIFGNIFGNTINLPTTGTRPDIYVNPDVMGSTGVKLPDFTQAEIVKDLWWEMNGAAAR